MIFELFVSSETLPSNKLNPEARCVRQIRGELDKDL